MFKFGKMQRKMQAALIAQAYLSYKYGWHQAQVHKKAKMSKGEFCRRIKEVIEQGKRISDGFDHYKVFPEKTEGDKH